MEPTAIGLISLNSNSETHKTAWEGVGGVFICCAALILGKLRPGHTGLIYQFILPVNAGTSWVSTINKAMTSP